MWVFAIIIVLVLGGVAAVASGWGSPMPEAYTDRPDALVPADGTLRAADLRKIRFSVTVRGYRMAEVDALLARLAAEADQREATGRADAAEPSASVDLTKPAGPAEPVAPVESGQGAAADSAHEPTDQATGQPTDQPSPQAER